MKEAKKEFEPNIEGFKHAKAWLELNNLYNRTAKRMDGYTLVFYANEQFQKKNK